MNNRIIYSQRIRQCFADDFKFLDTHKHIRTQEGFDKIAESLGAYQDSLTVDLIVAALKEIEREYHVTTGQGERNTA